MSNPDPRYDPENVRTDDHPRAPKDMSYLKHEMKEKIAKKMVNHKRLAKHLELPHGNPKYHKAMKTYLGMSRQDQDATIKANLASKKSK